MKFLRHFRSRSLATQLLRRVLGIYLLIALGLTAGQLLLEFDNEKKRLTREVDQIVAIFEPMIAQSLWEFDDTGLRSNLQGMRRHDIVSGVKVLIDGHNVMASSGTVGETSGQRVCDAAQLRAGLPCHTLIDTLYAFTRPVHFERKNGQREHVGDLVIYTEASLVLERTLHMLVVLLVNALIKTAFLWLIAWILLDRWLARPLGALTSDLKTLDLKATGERSDAPPPAARLSRHTRNELGTLIQTFTDVREALFEKNAALQAHREELEQRVEERTEALMETRQKLIASEKRAALGVFSAGMAHEINNPANFASAGAQNAREQLRRFREHLLGMVDESADPDVVVDIKRHIDRIQDSHALIESGIERITRVVQALRSAHPETADELVETDPLTLLDTVWMVVQPTLRAPIERVNDFHGTATLHCRPGDINQVFLALLTNAGLAIEDKRQHVSTFNGRITLKSWLTDTHLMISVEDNGIGIHEDILDRVFDPFFTTRTVGRGSGLGLSTALDIVKRHGGTLDVKSTLGEGSTFTVSLPVTAPG